MKEESLSDKILESYQQGDYDFIDIRDVKEAVKKLKEEIENPTYPYANVIQLIDKIFGEKLIGG